MAYDTRSGMAPHGSMKGETISPTLCAKEHEPPMVMQGSGVASFKPGQSAGSRSIGYEDELAPSLEARRRRQ